MSFSFACGDVMPGCPMTFASGDRDRLLGEVAAHASQSHGISEVPPSVLEQVNRAIRVS